jgi:Rha family phage regulatory protein
MNTQVQAVDFTSFVFASNDEIKTTSLLVAEKFGKTHAHVLRDIEKVMTQVSDIFNKTNFGFIEADVKVGFGTRKDKVCELTKDGFIMVVMSFTGAKAFAIKEAYINAFNLMHAKLFPKRNGLVDQPKPETLEDVRRKVVERWIVLVEIFGNQLINEYGTNVPKVWGKEFETMTDEQFKRGIQGIKKSKSPFMPRLPVFLAYCHEKDVVSAKDKDMELVDKKKQIAMPCESREDMLKHVDFNQARINR